MAKLRSLIRGAFAGWLLPGDKPVLLVARDDDQAVDAATTLQRIGFDNVSGFVSGAMPVAPGRR